MVSSPNLSAASLCVIRNSEVRDGMTSNEEKPTPLADDYCGDLTWTVRKWGLIAHKENCPYRKEAYHQGMASAFDAVKALESSRAEASMEALRLAEHILHAQANGKKVWFQMRDRKCKACGEEGGFRVEVEGVPTAYLCASCSHIQPFDALTTKAKESKT